MNIRKILFYKIGIGCITISSFISACSMSKKDGNNNNGIFALLAAISATAGSVTPTLTATGGNLQILLSWDTVAGAESYNLYHSTSASFTSQTGSKITGVTSPYVHTGQVDAASRSYILTAVRGGQEGPASSIQTATAGLCGNNITQTYASEACDDGNTLDNGNGCSTTCKRVGFCGDGTRQSIFEACDSSGVNAVTCDSDCTAPVCGDGIRNAAAGEACDDGNVNNGDTCNSTCSGP